MIRSVAYLDGVCVHFTILVILPLISLSLHFSYLIL